MVPRRNVREAALATEIKQLELERSDLEKRLAQITKELGRKYKVWHAVRNA